MLFAHHLLAYVEMLERDAQRLADLRQRIDVMPLGSGAIAGSTIALDRDLIARELGFAGDHAKQHGCRERPRFRRANCSPPSP